MFVIRLEVPVQASSFNPSSTSIEEGSRDEWQVNCFIRCGPFSQNHQCACLPPLPQAASRYCIYRCKVNMPTHICQQGIKVFESNTQTKSFKWILAFSPSSPPGQPLPPEMTLAQLLTLLYDRKLPQGYQSINLTVKLGSKVISDPGLSKTDSFKRLRTEKGTKKKKSSSTCFSVQILFKSPKVLLFFDSKPVVLSLLWASTHLSFIQIPNFPGN